MAEAKKEQKAPEAKKEAAPAPEVAKQVKPFKYKLKNVSSSKHTVPGGHIGPGEVVEVTEKSHKILQGLRKNYPTHFQIVGEDPKAAVEQEAKA